MSRKSNKKPLLVSALVVVGVVAAIIFGAGYFGIEQSSEISSDNPRVVDWHHVHGVGLDPSDQDILYIATHGDFYQSLSDGPPVKVDKVRADYMAFNAPPVSGIPLYASGHPLTGGNTGLIKSTDGGVTWQGVSNVIEPPVDFHAMAVSKQNPQTIIGFDSGARGLFKTTDAGKTWQTLEYPDYISALAFSPIDSQTIFAGTGNGIFHTGDGGNTWNRLDKYVGLTVYALAFDDNEALFASIETHGLVRSDDYGNTWAEMPDVDLTVTSMAADADSNNLYVGGYSSGGFHEVYKISYDGSSYLLIGTNKD